jgi:hypothetical protein
MEELVPIVLGGIFGAVIRWKTAGGIQVVLSIAAIVVSGVAATVLSGEYAESWVYLLLDLGEAALGLALGFLIAHSLTRAASADFCRATVLRYGQAVGSFRRGSRFWGPFTVSVSGVAPPGKLDVIGWTMFGGVSAAGESSTASRYACRGVIAACEPGRVPSPAGAR